ncbi:cyclase family protein [Streptomyces sp. NPDC002812]|uniref:cyclase family protein n=1 Tax=Streptomyces sp. NPDC002812 TaxID=3154434 RepID=UPI0033342F13
MCGPQVMHAVYGDTFCAEHDQIPTRQAGSENGIQTAGEARRSGFGAGTGRRKLLGVAGALGATVAGMGLLGSKPAVAATSAAGNIDKLFSRGRRVVDMSHPFGTDFPVYQPYVASPKIWQVASVDKEGYNTNLLTIDEHSGTHMDGPKHFSNGQITSDQIAAEDLIAPMVIIRTEERAKQNPDALLTYDDLKKWEARYGRIPKGAIICMDNGWYKRIHTPEKIFNRDEAGHPHFPGIGWDAAEFLQSQRDVVGVATDAPSMDSGAHDVIDPKAHKILLPTGHYGIEWTANMDQLPDNGAIAVIGLLKHIGGFSGPVRMFGIY